MKTQILQKKEDHVRKAEDRATTGGPVGVTASGGETPSEAGLGTLQRKLDTSPGVESSRRVGEQLNQGSSAVAQRSLAEDMSPLAAGEGVVQGNKFKRLMQELRARTSKLPKPTYSSSYRPDISRGLRVGGEPMPKSVLKRLPKDVYGEYDPVEDQIGLNRRTSRFAREMTKKHEEAHAMNRSYLPDYGTSKESPEQLLLDEIQAEWQSSISAQDQLESGRVPRNREDLDELLNSYSSRMDPTLLFERFKSDPDYMKQLSELLRNSKDPEQDPMKYVEEMASKMQISHFDDQESFDEYTKMYNEKNNIKSDQNPTKKPKG